LAADASRPAALRNLETGSSESSIRQNASSLKKFHTYLAEPDRVSADERAELCEEIKTGVPE